MTADKRNLLILNISVYIGLHHIQIHIVLLNTQREPAWKHELFLYVT